MHPFTTPASAGIRWCIRPRCENGPNRRPTGFNLKSWFLEGRVTPRPENGHFLNGVEFARLPLSVRYRPLRSTKDAQRLGPETALHSVPAWPRPRGPKRIHPHPSYAQQAGRPDSPELNPIGNSAGRSPPEFAASSKWLAIKGKKSPGRNDINTRRWTLFRSSLARQLTKDPGKRITRRCANHRIHNPDTDRRSLYCP